MAFSLGSAFKTDTLLSFIKDKYGLEYLKDLDYFVGKTPPIKKNTNNYTSLGEIATRTGVSFNSLNSLPQEGIHQVERRRTGLFQRYYGGNMDEGWTRLCLENFYTTFA